MRIPSNVSYDYFNNKNSNSLPNTGSITKPSKPVSDSFNKSVKFSSGSQQRMLSKASIDNAMAMGFIRQELSQARRELTDANQNLNRLINGQAQQNSINTARERVQRWQDTIRRLELDLERRQNEQKDEIDNYNKS